MKLSRVDFVGGGCRSLGSWAVSKAGSARKQRKRREDSATPQHESAALVSACGCESGPPRQAFGSPRSAGGHL